MSYLTTNCEGRLTDPLKFWKDNQFKYKNPNLIFLPQRLEQAKYFLTLKYPVYPHLPIKSTFFVRHDLQQGPNNISASSWRWRRHPPGLNWQREGKLKFYARKQIVQNGLLSELSSMNVNSMLSSKKADFMLRVAERPAIWKQVVRSADKKCK